MCLCVRADVDSSLASSEHFDTWRRGTALTMPLSVGGGVRWDAFPVPQIVKDLGNYLLDVGLPGWLGVEVCPPFLCIDPPVSRTDIHAPRTKTVTYKYVYRR